MCIFVCLVASCYEVEQCVLEYVCLLPSFPDAVLSKSDVSLFMPVVVWGDFRHSQKDFLARGILSNTAALFNKFSSDLWGFSLHVILIMIQVSEIIRYALWSVHTHHVSAGWSNAKEK